MEIVNGEEKNDVKILHINSYYNGSTFYKNLFDYQLKNGLDLSVFVPVSSSANNQEDFGSYTTISKNHNKCDRFIFHLKQKKIYKDLIDKYDIKTFSLLHAHSLFTNGYVAMKLKKNFGIPYVVAVRSTDINVFFKKMIHLRRTGVQILKNADRVIFLSKPYRDEVVKNYVSKNCREEILGKISIIPNGIDEFWLDNIFINRKKNPNKSNLRLLQVGDISKRKNIETTVKAIDLLIDKGYKIKLDLVGEIKDQNVFNKIKHLLYVNYLGFKTKDELLKIYRENDIFILPSITETFGLVYAEAMSQGLPVIYTRGQGFDTQFENGVVGYAVSSDDPDEITQRIDDIVENYSAISKNCVSLVNKFRWSKIASKYRSLYEKILI